MKRPRLTYNVAVYHRTVRSAGVTAARRRHLARHRLPGHRPHRVGALRGLRGDGPRRVADPAPGGRQRGRSGSSSSPSPSMRCARSGRPGSPAGAGRRWCSGSAAGSRSSSAPAAWPGRSSSSCCRRRPRAEEPGPDPLVDSGRPVPPSSRGLGRHPFKVEIRGSNPLGGTSTPGPTAGPGSHPCYHRTAMEIMGIEIRTIVKDNVAIRCDGCLEVIDGTPWRVNLLDIVASEAPVAWTERPTINPGPFQFHRDAGHVRRWMAGKGFLFCRTRRGPRDHAPRPDPDRPPQLGPVRRHPSRRSRVRPGLIRASARRSPMTRPDPFDSAAPAPISCPRYGRIGNTQIYPYMSREHQPCRRVGRAYPPTRARLVGSLAAEASRVQRHSRRSPLAVAGTSQPDGRRRSRHPSALGG